MALYLTKLVNGQVQKLRVSPTKAIYRGFWAIIIGGFAGTSVTCNGVTKFIGSNERVAFNIITPGTYTFTATRQGTTLTKEVTLNDDTQEYIINLSMFIGMQEVEYIESTGTQWIDTGVAPNNNTRVICEFVSFDSRHPSIFGARTSTGKSADIINVNTTNITSYYGGEQVDISLSESPINQRLIIDKNKNETTIFDSNGFVIKKYTHGQTTFQTVPTMAVFAVKVPNVTPPLSSSRFYYFKIYDNDVLVRDFIPIKDDTGHGALYDKVTQQIFYNSGTGDFVCGPNKKPYTRIQYIESTGTQWIDTGVTTFPVKYNLKIQLTDPTRNQAILGTLKVNVSTGNEYEYQIGTTSNKFYLVNTEPVFSDINSTSDLYNITGTINEVGTVRVGDVENPSQSTEMTKTALRNITPLRPIYVLNRYSSNATGFVTTGRLYSVQFYDIHNILVRDFIPVLDKNGTPCMYDKVEGKFYYNAGTGDFIAGPEK